MRSPGPGSGSNYVNAALVSYPHRNDRRGHNRRYRPIFHVLSKVLIMAGQTTKEYGKKRSSQESKQKYNRRRSLVVAGLASWYMPYKPLSEIVI